MSQPWSAYVVLSDQFSAAEREAMIAAFDQIAAFRDDEGMELLRTAFANNGGRPLQIEPSLSRSSWSAEEGLLRVHFEGINRQHMHGERPSLVNTLVHELYHAADDQRDILAQAQAVLLASAGMQPDDPRAAQLIAYAEAGGRPGDTSESDRAERIARTLLIERQPSSTGPVREGGPEANPYAPPYDPAMQALLQRLPVQERYQALLDSGVLSPETLLNERGGLATTILLRLENDAVHYTDALMAKNFGDAEPQRVTYNNGMELAEVDPAVPYLFRDLVAGHTAGFRALPYSAADMDMVSPPQVRATRDPSETIQR